MALADFDPRLTGALLIKVYFIIALAAFYIDWYVMMQIVRSLMGIPYSIW